MARQLSPDGAILIKQLEGLRFTAYLDTAGHWTIGYGHTSGVKEGDTCTQSQADVWFYQDIAWAAACVEKNVNVLLNDNQFAALVSFTYNVGSGSFENSTLLKNLNDGDYASVPEQMNRWSYITVDGRKVVSAGLQNRRNAEGGLWVKGSFVASGNVSPAIPTSPWKTLHVKIKAAGSAIAASGITAQSLHDGGSKLSDLGATLHTFGPYLAYFGIGLVVVGTLWGIFKSGDT